MTKYTLSLGRNIPNSNDTVNDNQIQEYLKEVSNYFLGFTITEVIGFWKGEQEKTIKLEIIADESDYDTVCEIALIYKNRFNQDSVMIEKSDCNVQF
jgi:Protein of unknown function (DUF3574)